MRRTAIAGILFGLFACVALSAPGAAKVSKEEAAKLGIEGTPLTPVGAIRAGNADGTIPAWTGGIVNPPADWRDGIYYKDPFAEDKPLFTITADNYKQYEDKLPLGNIWMFERYPDTYKMHVYQSRRTGSLPRDIYEKTMKGATTIEFKPGSERALVGAPTEGYGIPFPIPNDGREALMSHTDYFRGYYRTSRTPSMIYIVHTDGTYGLSALSLFERRDYTLPESERHHVGGDRGYVHWCLAFEFIEPPRDRGQIGGGCNYEGVGRYLDAYIYLPGQRRVRRAPKIGFYDSPNPGSDGLRMADQGTMWSLSGDEEWFDHKLIGRKEMFIPYNNYRLASPDVNGDTLIQPGHINQDLVRYELHRVWVTESTLRDGYRHLSPRRIAYFDEDSWAGSHAALYDARGDAWRISESFLMNFHEVPLVDYWGEVMYDLISGRYVTGDGFYKDGQPPDFTAQPSMDYFTPQGLRRIGIR